MPERPSRGRRRAALALAVLLAAAYALPLSGLGWNEGAHYALVRGLSDGTARIDESRWMTGDVALVDGHYYSTKAPGLALASLPAYQALETGGAVDAIERGSSRTEAATLVIWLLSLLTVVLPAALLVWLVTRTAESLEPGFGLAAGAALGLGTLVLPFATVYFSHVLAALLGFAAFSLLAGGGRTARSRAAAAGLAAGLAITTEYTLGIVAAALLVYVAVRSESRLRAAGAYLAGCAVGVLPLLAYNRWAFGSAFHVSYENAVLERDEAGRDRLGANERGIFGIEAPDPRTLAELLLAERGLLVVSPVLALGAVGIVALLLGGSRAEAALFALVPLAFLTVNAGYTPAWGGWTAGPRFLLPALAFLAVPIAVAARRHPAVALALGTVSASFLLLATVTAPLLPDDDTGRWARALADGELRETIVSRAGLGTVTGIVLLVAAAAAAATVAVRATAAGPVTARAAATGVVAVVAWAAAASVYPLFGADPRGVTLALVWSLAGVGSVAAVAPALAGRLVSGSPNRAEQRTDLVR